MILAPSVLGEAGSSLSLPGFLIPGSNQAVVTVADPAFTLLSITSSDVPKAAVGTTSALLTVASVVMDDPSDGGVGLLVVSAFEGGAVSPFEASSLVVAGSTSTYVQEYSAGILAVTAAISKTVWPTSGTSPLTIVGLPSAWIPVLDGSVMEMAAPIESAPVSTGVTSPLSITDLILLTQAHASATLVIGAKPSYPLASPRGAVWVISRPTSRWSVQRAVSGDWVITLRPLGWTASVISVPWLVDTLVTTRTS